MTRAQLEAAVRDLDARLSAVEQKLQQMVKAERFETAIARLATKAELDAAVARLATKAELDAAVARLATKAELNAAVARLATKAELQAAVADLRTAMAALVTKEEVHAEAVETRRHFDVVAESLRDDIKLIADAVLDHDRRIRRLEGRYRRDEG